MITANVLYRVFCIQVGNSTGTAFAIDVDGREYLVTAAHVLSGASENKQIFILRYGKWEPQSYQLVGAGNPDEASEDIAVLALHERIAPHANISCNATDFILGQDAYFLGFPYQLQTRVGHYNGYPVPIIKKGIIAGRVTHNQSEVLLLDGHNNSGFSGGPVVYMNLQKAGNPFCIAGVVHGYRLQGAPVTLHGQNTGLLASENTGLVICPTSDLILNFIAGKPIGCRL